MSNSLLEKIKKLVLPYLEKSQITLYDCEIVKEGKETILRFLIEKEDGTIDLATCVEVSGGIGAILDANDPIESEYMLEVSSPGVERPIKSIDDYHNAIGKYVELELVEPINGVKYFIGDLVKVENGEVHLQYRVKAVQKKLVVKIDEIKKANLAVRI